MFYFNDFLIFTYTGSYFYKLFKFKKELKCSDDCQHSAICSCVSTFSNVSACDAIAPNLTTQEEMISGGSRQVPVGSMAIKKDKICRH